MQASACDMLTKEKKRQNRSATSAACADLLTRLCSQSAREFVAAADIDDDAVVQRRLEDDL